MILSTFKRAVPKGLGPPDIMRLTLVLRISLGDSLEIGEYSEKLA